MSGFWSLMSIQLIGQRQLTGNTSVFSDFSFAFRSAKERSFAERKAKLVSEQGRDSSRHTPCAVRKYWRFRGRRHLESACYVESSWHWALPRGPDENVLVVLAFANRGADCKLKNAK